MKKYLICLVLFFSIGLMAGVIPVMAAVGADITDGDTDKVYFNGNQISFTVSGDDLIPLNGQTVRVAFGIITGIYKLPDHQRVGRCRRILL